MLLMIDNYDSFTYNLVQYFGELGEDVRVYRNDKITVDQIEALKPRRRHLPLGARVDGLAPRAAFAAPRADSRSCR